MALPWTFASSRSLLQRRRLGSLPPLVVIFALASTLGHRPPLAQDAAVDRFLGALEGEWEGRAETTPIGPRPYDIHFAATAPGRVEGSADTGASVHHWTFLDEGGELHLRFLSTFAGNREPIHLHVEEREGEAVLFRAARPSFLSVRVSPSVERLRIDVYHWGELHVAIRLTRRRSAKPDDPHGDDAGATIGAPMLVSSRRGSCP